MTSDWLTASRLRFQNKNLQLAVEQEQQKRTLMQGDLKTQNQTISQVGSSVGSARGCRARDPGSIPASCKRTLRAELLVEMRLSNKRP